MQLPEVFLKILQKHNAQGHRFSQTRIFPYIDKIYDSVFIGRKRVRVNLKVFIKKTVGLDLDLCSFTENRAREQRYSCGNLQNLSNIAIL